MFHYVRVYAHHVRSHPSSHAELLLLFNFESLAYIRAGSLGWSNEIFGGFRDESERKSVDTRARVLCDFSEDLSEREKGRIKKLMSALTFGKNALKRNITEQSRKTIHLYVVFPSLKNLSRPQVLDIGFNLMTELPVRAFEGNPSITLLAIDGNPLSTVPEEAFIGLNGTLRGLSLGGRFLVCDCKLRWIVEWIRTRDLQVTSRESKPQFCGSPPRLQERSFYTIKPEGR